MNSTSKLPLVATNITISRDDTASDAWKAAHKLKCALQPLSKESPSRNNVNTRELKLGPRIRVADDRSPSGSTDGSILLDSYGNIVGGWVPTTTGVGHSRQDKPLPPILALVNGSLASLGGPFWSSEEGKHYWYDADTDCIIYEDSQRRQRPASLPRPQLLVHSYKPPSSAFVDDNDAVDLKRARNTAAARRSRAKKLIQRHADFIPLAADNFDFPDSDDSLSGGSVLMSLPPRRKPDFRDVSPGTSGEEGDSNEKDHVPRKSRSTVSSYWSVSERQDFQRYISHFGRDFAAVADRMGTKSETKIKNHFQRQIEGPQPELERLADDAERRRARGEVLETPLTSSRSPIRVYFENGKHDIDSMSRLNFRDSTLDTDIDTITLRPSQDPSGLSPSFLSQRAQGYIEELDLEAVEPKPALGQALNHNLERSESGSWALAVKRDHLSGFRNLTISRDETLSEEMKNMRKLKSAFKIDTVNREASATSDDSLGGSALDVAPSPSPRTGLDPRSTSSTVKWRQLKANIKRLAQQKRGERMRVDHQY